MKNEKKALKLFLKSAKRDIDLRHIWSDMVGSCYENGIGILKDENESFEWYLKAAKKGHGFSQYLVAKYYNSGGYIPKNEESEFNGNRKAAINNNNLGQYELVKYYLNNKNERKAFKWYLKLANKNSLRAFYLIAKCYRDGVGTDKNLNEATKWFKEYKSKLGRD